MADVAQNVIINFESNVDGLAPAVDQLERLGQIDKATAATFKATNAEINKRTAVIKANASTTQQAANTTKKSIQDVDTAVKKLSDDFVKGFEEGVADALKEAGVSAEEFAEALKKGGTEVDKVNESIASRLKTINNELKEMRLNGEEATNPERYNALTKEAGSLRSAISDVNTEVQRAASSTKGFDSLIDVAQGAAGAFALAEGGAALFGKKSEDLQEVLVRVSGAMAILQGFQQLQELYSKRIAIALGLETVATTVQTAATTAFNFVVGTSTGLLKAFRIALASTGIGLLILGVAALVSYLTKEEKVTEDVNKAIERNTLLIEGNIKALQDRREISLANAGLDAKLETEISQIRADNNLAQQRALEAGIKLLETQRQVVTRSLGAQSEEYKKLTAEINKNRDSLNDIALAQTLEAIEREKQRVREALEGQIAITEAGIINAGEGSAAQLELQKKLVRDKQALELATQQLTEEQRLLIIAQGQRDQLELTLAFRKRQIDLDIKVIQDRLNLVEQGSNAELQLRRELLAKQAASELATTKLSEAERAQVREQSAREQVALELAFAAEQRRISIENAQIVRRDFLQVAIDRNATEIALLKDNNEEKLRLQLVSLELAASEERRIAGNNAIEINRINAETEQKKLALRLQFAQAAFDFEQRIEAARNGANVRAQQNILSGERSTFKQRVNAIIELTRIDAEAIDRRKQALRDQYKQGLISQEEYNVQYAELEDQRAAISEETEKRILEMTRARTIAQVQTSIEVAGQVIGVLDSLFQAQSDREKQRVDEQKARVDELLESGAITEKEANRRRKQLEIEEKQAQQRAAQRDKQIAVFRALLAIPSAFLQGLAQGGPILGAIYAAIAGIQAAIVIARPVPKFGKGKKNNYAGPAEVGETGAELIEQDGQMYIAPKSTLVWLGKKDKVYNPKETAAMLEKGNIRPARLPQTATTTTTGISFDYERLGEVIKRGGGVNLNIDGYKQFVLRGQAFTTYLNSRRGF